MIKKMLIAAIGQQAYREYVAFPLDLYHSTCLGLKENGMGLIHHLIPPGGTVFDIGANIGQFSNMAARITGDTGSVFAFEPGRESRRVLNAMLRLRRHHHVTVIDKALSDTNTERNLLIPLKNGWKPMLGLAHLGTQNDDEPSSGMDLSHEKVTLVTMDDFCGENNINRLDFIKCDTEGSELFIFRGGQKTIQHLRPSIFCEIEHNHCERYQVNPSEIFDFFHSHDYHAFLPTSGDSGLKRVREYVTRTNYFFIPKQRISRLANKINMITS